MNSILSSNYFPAITDDQIYILINSSTAFSPNISIFARYKIIFTV